MTPPPERLSDTAPRPPLPRNVAIRLWLARAVMVWERVWPAVWPALSLVIGFLILSFLGIWQAIPRALQVLLLFGLVFSTVFLLWRRLSAARLPRRAEGLRRLEDDSGLTHRPLSGFEDAPFSASDDPGTQALWRAHRARLAERVRHVGLVLPRTDSARHDPYALRLLLILALGVSLLIAGAEWGTRLRDAVGPFLAPPLPADAQVDAWIEPPDYTGRAMSVLVRGEAVARMAETARTSDSAPPAPVRVPEGSTLIVRASGLKSMPALAFRPVDGTEEGAPVVAKDQVMEGRLALEEGGVATLSYRGRVLGAWPISVEADRAPEIALDGPPQATPTAALRFNYTHTDDYGVTRIAARLSLVPETEEETEALAREARRREEEGAQGEAERHWPDPFSPVIVKLPDPVVRPGTHQDTALQDLADHPWAGRSVLVQLEARDGSGLEAYSEGVKITLPERVFLDPIARALVEQRKALADNPQDTYPVLSALDALTAAPEKFIKDRVAYLALRSAYWRLAHDPRTEEVREVYDMLWDIALRFEDGDLSQARDRLRQIQRLLSEALNRNAPASEIRQLVAQLKQAMDEYIAELMQNADRMEAADPDARTVGERDLDALMASIAQLAQMGDHAQARRLLAELNQLLEGIRPSASAGGSGQGQNRPQSPQEKAIGEALGDLSGIIRDQRALMDRTNRNVPLSDDLGLQTRQQRLRDAFRRAFEDSLGEAPQRPSRDRGADNARRPGADSQAQAEADALKRLLDSFPQSAPQGPVWNNRRADNDRGAPQRAAPFGGRPAPGEGLTPRAREEAPGLAREQAELREKLRRLRREVEEAGVGLPDDIGGADEAMGSASEALGKPDYQQSVEDQRRALERLRQGAEQLASELLRRQGKQQQAGARRGEEGGRDPLGREGPGGLGQGSVAIPDESEFQRVREVLEELRRRAGERSRPEIELEYYERLLRQF